MKKTILIAIILLLGVAGCKDILEDDLTGRAVELMAPPDSYQTTLNTHTFWWQAVEGAEGYDLQIVSPGFDYIERLFLDTSITVLKYDYTLLPGLYQWRVRAWNYSTSTAWSVRTLTIDSTSDISGEIVQLLSPADHDTTAQTQQLFQWQELYNADDYNFQLYYSSTKILSQVAEAGQMTATLSAGNGAYRWEVRGQNDFSNTAYYGRDIFLDTTPPAAPVPEMPLNGEVLADSLITFQWTREGASGGSSIKDSLYIYSDQQMLNIIRNLFLAQTAYQDSLGPGTFYWRLRSIDKAGNKSGYSTLRSFTVQ
ncbi:MAG: hypothetical protein JXA03_10525 [Bacteroidales bacterium]|nr:hypothetical protein [Bacteroidales bacterium]